MSLRRRIKVFVVGSFRDEHCTGDRKEFEKACRLLGEALAKVDCDLILNGESENTADPYIFDGYTSHEGGTVQIFRPAPEYTDGELTRPFAKRKTSVKVQQDPHPTGTFRTSHLRSISAADVVVAIGGSPRGTLNALGAADVLARPVAGITAFGGAAQTVYTDYTAYYKFDSKLNQLLVSNPTKFDKTWATDFVHGVVRLARTNPVRMIRPMSEWLTFLLIFGSIITWILIYIDFKGWLTTFPYPALLSLWLVSCVFGVTLRRVASALGLPVPSSTRAGFFLETAFALGVSFVLVLISLLSGNVLANKEMEVNLGNLQKTALGVSSLVFAATIVMELAWDQIVEWSTSRLK